MWYIIYVHNILRQMAAQPSRNQSVSQSICPTVKNNYKVLRNTQYCHLFSRSGTDIEYTPYLPQIMWMGRFSVLRNTFSQDPQIPHAMKLEPCDMITCESSAWIENERQIPRYCHFWLHCFIHWLPVCLQHWKHVKHCTKIGNIDKHFTMW